MGAQGAAEFSQQCSVHFAMMFRCFGMIALGAAMVLEPVEAVGLPKFLDVPRELIMDVNKPPYPIINVIADEPGTESGSAAALKEQRKNELARAKQTAEEQRAYDKAAGLAVRAQNLRLNKLHGLSEIAKHLNK